MTAETEVIAEIEAIAADAAETEAAIAEVVVHRVRRADITAVSKAAGVEDTIVVRRVAEDLRMLREKEAVTDANAEKG